MVRSRYFSRVFAETHIHYTVYRTVGLGPIMQKRPLFLIYSCLLPSTTLPPPSLLLYLLYCMLHYTFSVFSTTVFHTPSIPPDIYCSYLLFSTLISLYRISYSMHCLRISSTFLAVFCSLFSDVFCLYNFLRSLHLYLLCELFILMCSLYCVDRISTLQLGHIPFIQFSIEYY